MRLTMDHKVNFAQGNSQQETKELKKRLKMIKQAYRKKTEEKEATEQKLSFAQQQIEKLQ